MGVLSKYSKKLQVCFITLMLLFVALKISFAQPEQGLQFIENKGQWESDIKYKNEFRGGTCYLKKNSFRVLLFQDSIWENLHSHSHKKTEQKNLLKFHTFDLQFLNTNENSKTVAQSKLGHYYNYFIGNDKSKWAGNVGTYKEVDYKDLYTKID